MTHEIYAIEPNATQLLELIDPGTLLIDENIRRAVDLDKGFKDSIKALGVLTPVIAYRVTEGLRVFAGQRRTLAAVEVGREVIPVYIVETPDQAERLMMQLVENDRRADLSETERLETYKQLELLGVSPTKMARTVGEKRVRIEQSLTIAKAEQASAAYADGADFDMALAIAEFEDVPEDLAQIQACTGYRVWSLPQVIERLRMERKERVLIAEEAAFHEEAGRTVLEDFEYPSPEYRSITDLHRPTGEPADINDAQSVYIFVDMDSELTVEAYVQDWEAKGFTLLPEIAQSLTTHQGPEDDELAEAKKAERRELIANNRSMVAAQTVRKEWIAGLLKRKTAPKAYLQFIAKSLTMQRSYIGHVGLSPEAAQLAGVEDEDKLSKKLGSPVRPEFTILAMVLGTYEQRWTKDCWRNRHYSSWDSEPSWEAQYLTQLAAWGYPVSDVEQIILDQVADGRAAAKKKTAVDQETKDTDAPEVA
ncbi:ParB/RepB/Spo0J family partition protein [Arthrobacter russicus]|uniref:ParB/RepB/Spo0J family partition protein n=2 Tax=Bacillati TaxID=1783272 RepID=UPI003CE729EC